MAGLSDFYTGNMAPPDRLNGRLVPSLTSSNASIASMYRDIIPASSSALTSHPVTTLKVDMDGNPILPHASGTIALDKTQDRLPNDGTMLAYGSSPSSPQTAATAAIAQATSPWNFGSFSDFLSRYPAPLTAAAVPAMDLNLQPPAYVGGVDPWSGGRIGEGTQAHPVIRPVAPPPTPIQSLASMFTPAPSAYSLSPAGRDPSIHEALMKKQTDGVRFDQSGRPVIAMNGKVARANSDLNAFGMPGVKNGGSGSGVGGFSGGGASSVHHGL